MLNPQLNYSPQSPKTIHIMGICGTGMAALANMLQQAGHTITGSDKQVYPPMSDFLERIGIIPFAGYAESNLDHKPDLVIVGNVITKSNPEAVALADAGIPYLSFPQALAEYFIKQKHSLVVSGTHGKTTTCSLLASTLYHAGLDPSFMIGGIVSEFQSNNRLGNGQYFVAEGDEYDTAFFDKGSKFLHYRPRTAVITSIEFDHADIFTDISQIKASFARFIELLPPDGLIIAHLDDNNVAELVAKAPCRVEGYGYQKQNDWTLVDTKTRDGVTHFDVTYLDQKHQFSIPLTGRHNCLNSIAVIAVLNELGQSFSTISNCLDKFSGVKRRQEVRGVVNGITVIDDFAHHPTAVRETLDGLKKGYPTKRLVCVFEPRTNTSRRAIFQEAYTKAFNAADLILLREPIPLDNVAKDEQFSSATLAKEINKPEAGKAKSFETTEEILIALNHVLENGDVVAILSNGGFDNIHERLLTLLRAGR
ncbi:MAG: UDP-N-acetylmuramate:L-alanyl-gamma-D-glutamyl-meso-diaminopimelate ligase [Desulfocapsaceae bacterium]|nr:UDP-N-acetylmuramate:L-alanyl-gamma-D-glutamyl-meso-diaminopimelate ligase [Desulfocapsaceae bacterium]